MGEGRSSRALHADLALSALLCGLKLAIDACVLHAGFSHVSDDDYARTVIAQQFAHAPRLDPSGTSWLPLPFWITGAAMSMLGRSLGTARAVAIVLGAAGTALPYVAMRAARVSRAPALAATLVAMALPWNAWLGVATVPDGWTAALVAAGVIAMRNQASRPWCAIALLAASLARYEAWAASAVVAMYAAACGVRAARNGTRGDGDSGHATRRELAWAAVVLAGPALWMAWNAHAHGSPFHFIARVTAFRRAMGAADVPPRDKLFGYPRSLLNDVPEAVALGACGAIALASSASFRARWAFAALAAFAVLAFLVAGDLGDGAPTHHPARALGAVVWILVGMGVDALASGMARLSSSAARRGASLAVALAAAAWVVPLPARWAAAPGRSESERRDAQIARGNDLRRRDGQGAEVTPCQYEHFALIAAWGVPERAHVNPRTNEPLTSDCPRITVR